MTVLPTESRAWRPWVLATAAIVAACGGDGGTPPEPSDSYTITRSSLGVPHITAPSLERAAEGFGRAFAEDNFCLLQEAVLTVNGERSRVFGPTVTAPEAGVPNLESDVFHRFVIDTAHWRGRFEAAPVSRALLAAYAKGVNDHFASLPGALIDPACASYARPLAVDDLYRLAGARLLRAGPVQFIAAITQAKPAAAGAAPVPASFVPKAFDTVPFRPLASNGWAFGKDMVGSGKALLLGNPHFPWAGSERFYQARLTVPGVYDVAGVTLPGVPVIAIGYNRHVAWMHTVSAARRFTFHELALKPGDPLTYLVDGQERKLVPVEIEVPLGPFSSGATQVARRTLYRSEFGPMLAVPSLGLSWSGQRAYALQDVNMDNNRVLETWVKFGAVKTVRELQALLAADLSIPYFNTIAADDGGEVLYADMGAVPKVELADIAACQPSAPAAALLPLASLVVLKGDVGACNWRRPASASFADSLLPAARQPSVVRTDYVLNANDSYWLANPAHQFPADLSPILGPVGKPQGLRTRWGLGMVEARQAGTDGLPGNRFDAGTLFKLWSRSEVLAARLVLDDLLTTVCPAGTGRPFDPLCDVLRQWDRTAGLDARGAPAFREFWRRVNQSPHFKKLFAVPFDPKDPVHTPRGLAVDDPDVLQTLNQALNDTYNAFLQQKIPLDARLRDLQLAEVAGRLIPVPGGDDFEGVANKVTSTPLLGGRYAPLAGTTYLQIVELGLPQAAGGKSSNANGFLVYSQSTDPKNKSFGNQMDFYSTLAPQPLPDLR